MTWTAVTLAVVLIVVALLVALGLGRRSSRLALAWRVLRDPALADRVARGGEPGRRPEAAPARSEALSLLGVLQQEARLVDFFMEDLAAYSDAQIGAAVRDVHRDGAAALERLFAIRPLRKEPEGSDLLVPAGFDAGAVRLTGNVAGAPPYRGKLRHPGWLATRVELPRWTGTAEAGRVVSPAEIEVR
jgi:hypothetical protein